MVVWSSAPSAFGFLPYTWAILVSLTGIILLIQSEKTMKQSLLSSCHVYRRQNLALHCIAYEIVSLQNSKSSMRTYKFNQVTFQSDSNVFFQLFKFRNWKPFTSFYLGPFFPLNQGSSTYGSKPLGVSHIIYLHYSSQ